MSNQEYCVNCLNNPEVFGINDPSRVTDQDAAKPIVWHLNSGDTASLFRFVTLQDGTPITPDNSLVRFAFANTQFYDEPIWAGTWRNGVMPVDPPRPGIIKITIPASIMICLRMGSYFFALQVSDLMRTQVWTPLQGAMLIQYTPAEPMHNIWYNNPNYQPE